MFARVGWGLASPLFRFSPRPLFGLRRFLLRRFGARIGKDVHIYNSATIYMPWNLEVGDWSSIGEHAFIYNLGKVKIGERTTISHRAHLCAGTHEYTDPALPLLKPAMEIGDNAWICADGFIGPGVTVGDGAVVGARAVVVRDVEPWSVVAGNPAVCIKKRKMNNE
ncbi:MAG: putative colanic acid biosynthesis acetyltransferase [Thermodesulfobacteriota bacterium]|nr:putative colanic acid biosynthesis acetyltransferase [Thermodesulfobacteriota bacterium]